jgi:hypothetical protein
LGEIAVSDRHRFTAAYGPTSTRGPRATAVGKIAIVDVIETDAALSDGTARNEQAGGQQCTPDNS